MDTSLEMINTLKTECHERVNANYLHKSENIYPPVVSIHVKKVRRVPHLLKRKTRGHEKEKETPLPAMSVLIKVDGDEQTRKIGRSGIVLATSNTAVLRTIHCTLRMILEYKKNKIFRSTAHRARSKQYGWHVPSSYVCRNG